VKRVTYLAAAMLFAASATTACGAGPKAIKPAGPHLSAGQVIPPTFPTTNVLGCVSKSIGSETEPVIVDSGTKFWKVFWNADTGCIAIQESKGVGKWTSYSVTKDALNGGRIANVNVEMLTDAAYGWILVSAVPHAGQAPRALFRTVDGGKAWAHIKEDPLTFPMNSAWVNWSFTSPNNGWMVTADSSYSPNKLFIYRSTDGGVAWEDHWIVLPKGLHEFAALPPTMTGSGQTGTLTLRALAINNKQYVVLTYATSDGGVTWQRKSKKTYTMIGITPSRLVPTGVKATPTGPAPTISLPLLVGSKAIQWKKKFQSGYTISSCTRVGYQAFHVPVPPAQAMEMLTRAFVAPDYMGQVSVTYGPNHNAEADITYASTSSNIVVIISFERARHGSYVAYWVSDILPAKSGYTCRSMKL
jgi:hypothetical protein